MKKSISAFLAAVLVTGLLAGKAFIMPQSVIALFALQEAQLLTVKGIFCS